MLESIRLDAKTEAIYRLMVLHPDWHTREIANRTGATETEMQAALQRLVDLRLLRWSLDDPDRLLPLTPALAFQALLHHQHAEVLQKQQEFLEFQAEVARLTAEYSALASPSSRNELQHLFGLDAVQALVEALGEQSSAECLSFMPGHAQSSLMLDALRPLHESMLTRGLKVLTLYLDSAWNDSPTLHYAKWLVSMGGEVRTVPVLPLHAIIFDREVAIISIDPEASGEGAVQVSGQSVMALVVALFERVWETGTPLGHAIRRDEQGLTAQERELLRLLSHGLTDDVVGKRLGLGVRTVRRMTADIAHRLNAHSRFEMGAKACSRGWLKPGPFDVSGTMPSSSIR
jgi:DNA-binding CsgD family transcriptional regulator